MSSSTYELEKGAKKLTDIRRTDELYDEDAIALCVHSPEKIDLTSGASAANLSFKKKT